MSENMRILFCDDQFPHSDEGANARVKSEIVERLAAKYPERAVDWDAAYEDDFAWFTQVLAKLRRVHHFEVIGCSNHEAARDEIARAVRGDARYDAIVIDLSWPGDWKLPVAERDDAGYGLIKLACDTSDGPPVIAFSQNYLKTPTLMERVVALGAMPIQKSNQEALGSVENRAAVSAQALAGAIHYLGRREPAMSTGPDSVLAGKTDRGEIKTINNVWQFILHLVSKGGFMMVFGASVAIIALSIAMIAIFGKFGLPAGGAQ